MSMNFSISSAELKEQLQAISGAIGNNPVLPILEDVLFTIKDNVLTITATDLETFMTAQLQVQSDADIEVAIPAKILLDTLKGLPIQPITFTIQPEHFSVTITSAYGNYELAGEDGADFPKRPQAEDSKKLSIAASTLLEGINKTLFATSNDDLRPAMTGVLFQINDEGLTLVSTDAHKLVRLNFSALQFEEQAALILPKKALNLLKSSLANSSQEVEVYFGESNAFFYYGNQSLFCRLIDAKYPDYNAVIPKENPNLLSLTRSDLLQSLKRIANFANKHTNQVKFDIKEDVLTIEAEDLDFSNKGKEQLPCSYEGEPMVIGFNAKFLIEMLNVLSCDRINIELSSPNRAGIIRPEQAEEGEDLLMLVMPLTLNV